MCSAKKGKIMSIRKGNEYMGLKNDGFSRLIWT